MFIVEEKDHEVSSLSCIFTICFHFFGKKVYCDKIFVGAPFLVQLKSAFVKLN